MMTQPALIDTADCDCDAHVVQMAHYYRLNIFGQLDPCGEITVYYDPLSYHIHAAALRQLAEAIIVRAIRETASKTVLKDKALSWLDYANPDGCGGMFTWAEYDLCAVMTIVQMVLDDPERARKNFVRKLPHNWEG
jgi:hypothetical protein